MTARGNNQPQTLRSVTELADLILTHPAPTRGQGPRLLIALAGAPAAGKSTTAAALAEALNGALNHDTPGGGQRAAVLAMDGYHFDDEVLNQRGHRVRKGAPHTFDVAGLAHMLGRLRANDEAEIAVPAFDRSIEIARAGAGIIPRTVTHIVVEGNYLLVDDPPWHRLTDLFDLTVFIEVPETELRRRLSRRWAELSDADARSKLEENDLPNARLVATRSRPADYRLQPIVID